MDKKTFDEIQDRLTEVNKVIEKLDPAIRASAFELLKSYVKSNMHSQADSPMQSPDSSSSSHVDLATLIEKHSHDKPSDNVHLLAARWYQRHGSTPFTLEALKQSAEDAGLIVPERLDMTLKQAQDDGKKLYTSAGHGLYKPTVNGELYIKKVYGLTKGTEPASAAAS